MLQVALAEIDVNVFLNACFNCLKKPEEVTMYAAGAIQ
jgi:hypothetical protein